MVSKLFIEYLLYIQEATSYSTIRRNRKVKRSAFGGRSAVEIARDKRDPLYLRYEKFRHIYLSQKKAIMKKYGAGGYRQARKVI